MDEKAVRTTSLELFFFIDEPGCFTDMVSAIISDQY